MEQPIRTINSAGIIEYKLNGKLHRVDGPAVIKPDGTEYWFRNDKRHRTDGPAMIMPDGREVWWRNSKLHRTDGPAIIWPDGSEEFWLEGKKVDIMVHFLQRP